MPAQSISIRQFVGLFVQANSFSAQVPDGAFEEAENIVFSQDGLCKKRRGLSLFSSSAFSDPTMIAEYNDTILVAEHTKLYKLDSAGTPTQFTDSLSLFNVATDGSRARFQAANGNLFFTSTNGVLKVESTSSGIRQAGIPRALDLQTTLSGVSGFLANNFDVAYRIVFGRKDINNNTILGAPSEYTVVINTAGGSRDVDLQFTLPFGLVADEHFYQIYRTAQIATTLDTDENTLQLIYERKITSTEITNGYGSFTDNIADIFREGGAFLYTNPNQEGILASNWQPPKCADIALFKEMLFFANTETKHTLPLSLISTTNLLNNSVTFTVGGTTETYTAKAVENIASKEFQRFTTGTPSQQIENTAKSFCKVINRQTSGKLYALYLSSVEDIPGKMLILGRNFSEPFSATVNSSTISNHFQPELPTSGTTVASTNDALQNAVYVSKRGIAEAVPITNYYLIGSKGDAILRVVPLRDSLIVISEGGVFSVRGESPDGLVVIPIDTTAICKSKNSVTVLNNTVYMLSTQGVVAVSDTSVQVVSRNIEPLITAIVGNAYLDLTTFATSYESERLLLLSTIEPNSRLTALTQTVTQASLTSNVASITFDSVITAYVFPGDIISLSGFTGGFSAFNGTFYVQSVSGSTVSFVLVGSNIALTGVSSISVSVIGANVVYCYNTVTQAWSTWDSTACFKAGLVSASNDKLYLLNKESSVLLERKNATKLDYTERSYSATAANVDVDGKTSSLTITGYSPLVGDAVVYNSVIHKILEVDATVVPTIYTYDINPNFANGNTVTVHAQYQSLIVTSPITLGDSSRGKRFQECSLMFRTKSATRLDISFKTNLIDQSGTTNWVTTLSAEGWGTSPWGLFAWGLPGGIDATYTTQKNQHVRLYVPREAHRANYLQVKTTHSVASEVFDLQSLSLMVYAYGTETTT